METNNSSPLPSPRSRFTVTPVAAPVEPCPAQETNEVATTTTTAAAAAAAAAVILPQASASTAATDSKDTSPDYTSLIRSSPSKVIVGFDVLTP